MTVIEIEDYNGNTIMAFRLNMSLISKDIAELHKCDIADEDGDYIFNSKENLIRIQSTVG
jgi:hypothetical protein